MSAPKLTSAQRRMLESMAASGRSERYFGSNRLSGRACRAWDRTTDALVSAGLVAYEGRMHSVLTPAGRAALEQSKEQS
jgi:hypothetical protein